MSTPQDPFGPPGDQDRGAGQPPGPNQWPGPQQPFGAGPGQPAGQAWGQADQPWGQAPWGQAPPVGPKRNGLGTAALVVGLLALIFFWTIIGGIVLGLLAVGLGIGGRRRAKRGVADNGGIAVAGLVLGVLSVLAAGALIAAGVALFQSDTGRELVECVQEAPDQAAAEQCRRQFEDSVGQ